MRANRRSAPFGLILILIAAVSAPALGAGVVFDSPPAKREIKACVLNAGANAHPRLFVALQNADICPEGWRFVNPLAPPEVTGTMGAALIRPGVGTGWAVLDSWGAYWQFPSTGAVSATTDLNKLVGMDVIYICTGGSDISIPVGGGKSDDGLLRAVENGALLWIDHQAGQNPGISRLPTPRTKAVDPGAATPPEPTDPEPFVFAVAGGVASRALANSTSELFNIPFDITLAADLNALGGDADLITWPYTDANGWFHETDASFRPLMQLLDGGGNVVGPAAILATYGSGGILVTAGNIGTDIQNAVGGQPTAAQRPEVMFAYNAINWLFKHREHASAGTKGAVSSLYAPVDIKWQFPRRDRINPNGGATIDFGPVVGAPLFHDGRLYVLTTQAGDGVARLVCLDPEPEQDLCGGAVSGTDGGDPPDGESDDGIEDYGFGAEYDVIWVRDFAAAISPKWSSVVGAFLLSGTYMRPVVLCATTNVAPGSGEAGTVWCIWADDNSVNWTRAVPGYDGNSIVCDLSTPVVDKNWVHFTASEYDDDLPGAGVEKTYGRAWCVDLATGGDASAGAAGAYWVYPERDLDRDGTVDAAADSPEPQRSLPCFNDPVWVMNIGGGAIITELPPLPTAAPIVTSNATLQDGSIVDAMMTVSAAVTHVRHPVTGAIVIDSWSAALNRGGGCEIALVPTPIGDVTGGVPEARLNNDYYCVKLANGAGVWTGGRARGDTAAPTIGLAQFTESTPVAATPGAVHFNSIDNTDSGTRQFLARWSSRLAAPNVTTWALGQNYALNALVYHTGAGPGAVFRCILAHNPSTANDEPTVGVNWRTYWVRMAGYAPWGCDVELGLAAAPAVWESYHLPGPVRWQRQLSYTQRQWSGAAISPWLLNDPYVTNDLVSHPAGSDDAVYICISNHTSAAVDEPGVGANWANEWDRVGSLEAPVTRGVALGGTLFAASGIPVVPDTANPPDPAGAATIADGAVSSRISAIEMESGKVRWRVDPRGVLPPLGNAGVSPPPLVNHQALITGPLAAAYGTIVAAVSQWPTGGPDADNTIRGRNSVLGLRDTVKLQVRLGAGIADDVGIDRNPANAPVVQFFEQPGVNILPIAYEIDYDRRLIRVKPEYAHDMPLVGEAANSPSDPIAGKAVLVAWTDTNGTGYTDELHVLPPAHDFTYVPGFIKLDKYPVDSTTLTVLLPDDTPDLNDNFVVTNTLPGEATVNFNYGSGARALLPNGWLDMRAAYVDRNENGVQDAGDVPAAGLDVIIAYRGFYEATIGWTDTANQWPAAYDPIGGFVQTPNPALSLRAEVHQVPVAFGQSFASPTVGGSTILLGTDGHLGVSGGNMWDASFAVPAGAMSEFETLLALDWDPATHKLWGRMVQPAEDDAGNVPIVRAPVTTIGGRAFVGSAAMTEPGPPDSAAGTGNGYVSMMTTERTLIAAGSRIIECVGAKPIRVFTGSYFSGNRMRPFGHIAKATPTGDGNVLVVDSGNNEVFEMDRHGRRVWPTNAAEAKMLLDRPTDAWRYETDWAATGPLTHTVIADAGHKRIVEWVNAPGGACNAYIVSPPYVNAATAPQPPRYVELEYQKAQPILDPDTEELWGYLACASNWNAPIIVEAPGWAAAGATYYPARVNPLATDPVLGSRVGLDNPAADRVADIPGGTTWVDWAFVYGLQFTNIRQAQYATFGNRTFVWVLASTYGGTPGDPMGVYEFPVPLGAYNLADPYRFTRISYVATGHGSVTLPSGQVYYKSFFPTSAQRLRDGDYIIANYAGATDHLNPTNLDRKAFGQSLGSEVFRVISVTNSVYGRQMIPDPAKPAWPEPLSLISYAERF